MKMIIPSISSKKGSSGVFALMVTATLAIAVVFLALTVTGDIMQDVRSTQTADSAAANTSTNSLTAIANLSAQGGNIGLIVGIGFLLLVLIAIFGKMAMGTGGNGL